MSSYNAFSNCMPADPLVPEPSAFAVELAIDKLNSHNSRGIDEILAELIEAGGGTLCLEIHKLITSIWKILLSGRRRNCLKSGRSRS